MKKKQVQNQAQEGRSMIEMLGVLAIIGVLSIGGIAGYRMAMNRYQANQIANEINLMRTDAKMKVARGVELLLGEPYDGEDGHLNFNANYGVKVESKDIFDEETSTTETGYSFTLFGIPAGVCKPLATLLDGMDDTAVLEINGGDYTTTENPCSETENEIEVAFSTKDLGVSGGEKEICDEATCEGYCSADGACKDCPADAPWNEATKQCKCKTSSKHWNKEIEACAACADNSHCTSSSKPACIEGVCSACTEESQCDTTQNKHCSSSGSCVTCGSSASAAAWNETVRKCDTCKNVYPEKPNWSGSECVATCPEDKPISYNNQCVECRKNEDCDKKGDGNHYWCNTGANYGTCKPCFKWDESTQHCQRGECESNADCNSKGDDYYCQSTDCSGCSGDTITESCNIYNCFRIGSPKEKKINGKTYYLGPSLNWWSAQRYCEALRDKKHKGSGKLLSKAELTSYRLGEALGNSCKKGDECCTEGKLCCDAYSDCPAFNCYAWTSTPYYNGGDDTSCRAYSGNLYSGNIDYSDTRNSLGQYALCGPED